MTPLGHKALGYFNTTWANFKAGEPDPKKFDVTGVATCPKAAKCGAPPLQEERLALGMHFTFGRYAQGDDW